MNWHNRYENKYGRIYDNFKKQTITHEIDKDSCDNVIAHLNSHCETIDRLIKNGKYLFEHNNKLKEEIMELKIENEAQDDAIGAFQEMLAHLDLEGMIHD